MFNDSLTVLTLITSLGAGLVAGVFYGFSPFIMRGLARQPPGQGMTAMQSINVTVINGWFMLPFLGTAVTSAVLIVAAVLWLSDPDAIYRLAGGGFYLVGTILVTLVRNVPRNDALAALDPQSAGAASDWQDYVAIWTVWNTVRTVTALVVAGLLGLALITS